MNDTDQRHPKFPWIVAETFAVYVTSFRCDHCHAHRDVGYLSADNPDRKVELDAFVRKHSTCSS